MPLLGAVEIRNPIQRTIVSHDLSDHLSPSTWANHVQNNLIILKDPFPFILSLNACACFIRIHHSRRLDPVKNSLYMGIKPCIKALEHISNGSLADREPKYMRKYFGKPLVTHVMAIAHIGHDPLNASPKRRTFLESLRCTRFLCDATGFSDARIQAKSRHFGFNGRNFNLVIFGMNLMVFFLKVSLALTAFL